MCLISLQTTAASELNTDWDDERQDNMMAALLKCVPSTWNMAPWGFTTTAQSLALPAPPAGKN